MTPTRYFSLRSSMGPPASNLPLLILGALAVMTVVGLFADIATIGV